MAQEMALPRGAREERISGEGGAEQAQAWEMERVLREYGFCEAALFRWESALHPRC